MLRSSTPLRNSLAVFAAASSLCPGRCRTSAPWVARPRDVRVRNVKLRKVMIMGALAGAVGCASAPPPSKTTPPAVAAAPAGLPAGAALVPEGPPVERIAVPLGGPARGPSTAKVTIVEFSDFQCPFCGRVNATLEQLLNDYPQRRPPPVPPQPAPLPQQRRAGRRSGGGRREAGEVLGDARQAVRESARPRAPGAGAARRPAGPGSDGLPGGARHPRR